VGVYAGRYAKQPAGIRVTREGINLTQWMKGSALAFQVAIVITLVIH
jgi:hypothetical protein